MDIEILQELQNIYEILKTFMFLLIMWISISVFKDYWKF